MELDTIAVDESLLVGGVWWDFHTKMPCSPRTAPHDSHLCFLVVPYGNDHARALDDLRAPHLDEVRRNKGRLPDDVVCAIRGAALARTVLKGWANAELGGDPLPFSVAKAEELLSSPKWTLLRQFIESAASNEYAILQEEEAAAEKN